jgi:hypothetical protein
MSNPSSDVQAFELTQTDRIALVGLTTHPGFRVLTSMMDAACQRMSAKVLQCDRTNRDEMIVLADEARAANVFVNLLRQAINWHVKCENVTKKPPEKVKEIA